MNQINANFQIGILISVARIHGTNAEKKIIAEILVIAVTSFTAIVDFTTNNEGKNISINEIADAFASNGLSAIGKI